MITIEQLHRLAAHGDSITLHHGTDFASAADIRNNGLSFAAAVALGGTSFWATDDPADAEIFAQVNPAGGQPSRLDFELPAQMVIRLLSAKPPQAELHTNNGIEFFARSFQAMNQHMANKRVKSIP